VLLADDMGLGKTLQALSFLAWVRADSREKRPALIVAPTGLLANWGEEIDRHLAPGALGGLVRAYGSGLSGLRASAGRDTAAGGSRLDPDRWVHAGAVLTTYETMRDYQFSFARTPFAVVIYDEVQKLKNPTSQVTAAARPLNAKLQIAMTGTPVENRLQDIWSILDVVHPGVLGSSRDFEREYAGADIPKLKALNDLLTKPQGARPPIMLRRMKHGHVEGLPDKTVVTYGDKPGDLTMPPAQARAYADLVGRAVAARGAGADRGRMLEVLHQLRSISLHPRPPEAADDFDTYAADSARLKQLMVILDGIAARGEKVLVFCESLSMQAQLAVHLRRRYRLGHTVACINGEMAGDKRQAAVRAFQSRPPGFDIIVLSPKAGGVGLTLTAANHVVHLSRWWNPAVEDQSTDRVHRIGQTRPVTVHLPLAVHPDPALRESSFDLKLNALMDRKRRLSRDLLAPPESEGDLSGLFDGVTALTEVSEHARPHRSDANLEPEPTQGDASKARNDLLSPLGRASAHTPEPARQDSFKDPISGPHTTLQGQTLARWPTRAQFRPGQRRDWKIFSGPLEDEICIGALLRDPYAGARQENRRAVADFFRTMRNWTQLPTEIKIVCWDAESAAGPYAAETNTEQVADFQRVWSALLADPVPKLRIQPRSKRTGFRFHDRSLEVRTRSGRTLIWDIGSGIDGLMRVDQECTVSIHTSTAR
jgi:superfamily II DNA or RNA helicase